MYVDILGLIDDSPTGKTNSEVIASQEAYYEDFVDSLAEDIADGEEGHAPRLTTGMGVYVSYDGSGFQEQNGPPRLVVPTGKVGDIGEEVLNEPDYYRQYVRTRHINYRDLLSNSVQNVDFGEMIDFSTETTDRYFGAMLHLDLTSEPETPPEVYSTPSTHQKWEWQRQKYNEDITKISHAFEDYTEDSSKEQLQDYGVWVQNRVFSGIRYARRLRKTQQYITENTLQILQEAADRPSIVYVALEEAKARVATS